MGGKHQRTKSRNFNGSNGGKKSNSYHTKKDYGSFKSNGYNSRGKSDFNKKSNNSSNGHKPYKKSNNNHPRPKGFMSNVTLNHLDVSYYSKVIFDTYLDGTHEEYVDFRSKILDNYHVYEIVSTVNNHFASGYDTARIAYLVAERPSKKDRRTVRLSIFPADEIEKNADPNGAAFVLFNGIIQAKNLFSCLGYKVSFLLSREFYNKTSGLYKKNKFVEDVEPDDNKFIDILGSVYSSSAYVRLCSKSAGINIASIDHFFIKSFVNGVKQDIELEFIPTSDGALVRVTGAEKASAKINKTRNIDNNRTLVIERYNTDIPDDILKELANDGLTFEYNRSTKTQPFSKPEKINIILEDKLDGNR